MPIYQASTYRKGNVKYLQIRESVDELEGELIEPIKTRHDLKDIHQIREIAEDNGCHQIDLMTHHVCKQVKIKY